LEKKEFVVPQDVTGKSVSLGDKVRVLSLSGQWLDDLPTEEKSDLLSMIGEIFEIEEIDQYGYPWIRKSWPNETEGKCHSHSLALEPHEMELVHAAVI
jgi:hypothetical protein